MKGEVAASGWYAYCHMILSAMISSNDGLYTFIEGFITCKREVRRMIQRNKHRICATVHHYIK